jgi:integrase
MRVNLTERRIAALKPDPTGKRRPELRDAVVPGLVVRCAPGGKRSYCLQARFPGNHNPVRRVIGEVGALTLEQARNIARDWHEQIRRGVDPALEATQRAEEARRAALAAQERDEHRFANVAAEYLARRVTGRQRQAYTVERIVHGTLIPAWGDKLVGDITRKDVIRLVEQINDRGAPVMAAAVFSQARALFHWAEHRGTYDLERSPCDRVRVVELVSRRKALRQRVLTDDELRAFWKATGRMAYPQQPMLRLLLLTGMRKNEAAGLRWSEVDLERGVITVPPERYKTGQTFVLPLSAEAVALLRDLPRFKRGDCVFSFTFGETPALSAHSTKAKLDALIRDDGAEVAPWVVHDLRRTVRTRLAALRIQDHVAEACLGHARKGIQAVYDRHGYEDEKREALQAWASLLRSIVEPRDDDKVVPLRGKGA